VSKLSTRLSNLEKRRRPVRQMLGLREVHCIGGWSHIEGQRCEEHEQCVFEARPLPGALRRIIMYEWQEGITHLFE